MANNQQFASRNKGFSMIEMMVAMSLFTVAIAITIGIFLQAVKINKTALSLVEANDNLMIAIEEISRSVRQGVNFTELPNSKGVQFTDALSGSEIIYQLNDEENAIIKTVGPPSATPITHVITPDTVKISGFQTVITTNSNPKRVTVKFLAAPKGQLEQFTTRVQTTISSRFIEE